MRTDPTSTPALAALQEHLYTQQKRRRLFPLAAVMGLFAGGVAVAFRITLTEAERWTAHLWRWAHTFPMVGWLVPVLICSAFTFLAAALVRWYSPEAAGSGIPNLEAVLRQYRPIDGHWLLPVKFVGGVLALSSGLALGREGPSIQMGAAVVEIVARPLRLPQQDRLTLLAAGAGAGLSAAFNAPLAGLIFVIEELQGNFRPIMLGAALVASVTGDLVARLISGPYPALHVPSYPFTSLHTLPWFGLLGAVAGLLGVAFNRGLLLALAQQQRRPIPLWHAAAIGAVVGLLSWFLPEGVGSSRSLFDAALSGTLLVQVALGWLVFRFLLTILSYIAGTPGGIFAPLLILGALLGNAIGQLAHRFDPAHPLPVGAFAVVGMAALFTAIVRAPLTGIVLILEMTSSYSQMFPVLVACFMAYVGAEIFHERPIYEALLERELAQGEAVVSAQHPIPIVLQFEPGSPFDGRQVQELGLPPGCLLVAYRTDQEECLPTATTVLAAPGTIVAIISPDAPEAMEALQQGCRRDNRAVTIH